VKSNELIDNLLLDYNDLRQKRHFAIRRMQTEYVATLDERMRLTLDRLDAAVEAEQAEQYLGDEPDWSNGYSVVTTEPTASDWRRVAARYVETGSKEDYKLMLSLVRLDHPMPNLWAESETAKTTSKTTKPMTLEDVWYSARIPIFIGAIIVAILIFLLRLVIG
jgi:hypothetical protein